MLRGAVLALLLGTSASAFAAAPNATTSAATGITTSSALLNGTGTPNGEFTTGWFRYSTTNPGTCSDMFGTRVPAVEGTELGSGGVASAYSITTTGLSPGTTYYFCAIVSNASGTAFGAVLSFTIPAPPMAMTTAATLVASGSATLGGSANPVGASTTAWFRYDTSNPGTCNDSFGTRTPTSSGQALGSGTAPVDYTRPVSGLLPGTTYYFCTIAQSSYGTSFGSVLSFTTLANAPVVTTSAASMLTGTTGQLNGSANPGGALTTGWFRYGLASPGTCNDTFGARAPASGGTPLGAGSTTEVFSEGITGLVAGTTYFYCAIASNEMGTSFGSVRTFTAPAPPTVTTSAATSVTSSSASLNGSADPNAGATTGYFRYATANPGTCNDTFGSRAPVSGGSGLGSGTTDQPFSNHVSGLSAATTYYYCAIASNGEGTAFGAVMSFTTSSAPNVTTSAATAVTATTATLNGSANPNGAAANGWYRYATTDPGSCNDSFGARTPLSSSSDPALGMGTSAVAYAQAIGGLTPATTYYFCALARNSYGTSFGAVLSFTTPAAAPSVTTTGASLLTGTTAQLNGSANPGGAAATGWFRYALASPGTCNDTFGTRAPASGGSSLGSGTTNTAFSEGITGLTSGTTYYYCAFAESAVGIAFGTVRTFTTAAPPTVATSAATSVTSTAAWLNGAGDPNGAATTGYFRYATTNPGTCNDTFGSRAPASGGSSLGTGTSSVAYSERVTGLSIGTTYYFCAIVTSGEGTAFGAVMSFTTTSAPSVTTSAATAVAATTATLHGSANPNGALAYGWLRYATSDPGTCNDSFGTRTPSSSSSDASLGMGTSDVAYAYNIAGLTPATTYYFCALARNSYGTSFGEVLSFTTPAAVPSVSTLDATLLTGTTAQLNASSNPGGAVTSGWFRYALASPGTCNDSFGTRAPVSGGSSLGSGTTSTAFAQSITGLTAATTYYFCALVQSAAGTSFGAVRTFTTPSPPTVATAAATSITSSSASLNGSADPNGASTSGYFRYATTSPGTCNDTFGSRAPVSGGSALGSGTTAQAFARTVSGLSSGTTYYFCAIAESGEGTAFGAVMSFTTSSAPIVTTSPAMPVTARNATFQGSANPNGATSYGWYRYSTSDPGTCNDSFGTRAPGSSASDQALGMGTSDVAYPQAIASLTPATTYYFCALARNSYGTSFGEVLSFTTPAAAPTVTTNDATLLTGTTAQLNASSNPGGAATTGWFRYSTSSPGTCNDTFGTRAPASGGSSLGSDTTNTSFSQGITGLTPATTYYFCALAQSSVATVVGAVRTFTTAALAEVTTLAAASVTSSTAYLNGSADPNGAATIGYFRYATTSPGTCNDTFGSRAPAGGGSSLGTGTTPQSFNQHINGLSAGTTYYFCALATSSEGTAFGAVLSFTTSSAPTVTTSAATTVLPTTARLNGSADPNGAPTSGWFRYSTTSPGTCNDSFGTRSSGSFDLGSGTSDNPYTLFVGSLTPATTYYFCAIANNSYGMSFGELLSFTTPAAPPTVSTSAAGLLTGTSARLSGSGNPGGAATTGWFRYGTASPGTCNDSFGTRAPATGGSALGSGTTNTSFGQDISGLSPATTYYYCAIVSSSVGTAFGNVVSFMTPAPPTVATLAASSITNTAAYLNGSADPNGAATTGYFRFSLTHPGTCNDTFGSRAPVSGGTNLGSGDSSVGFAERVTGLSSGTTYYYCAIASSAEGTAFGAVMSLDTLSGPIVSTAAATPVTSTTATLNGSASPNGDAAYGYFRYGAVSPGACDDSFGTRTPPSSGSDTYLGADMTTRPYSRPISGLTPGTTYYFCAIARNSYGTSLGGLLSFTTPASQPSVSTLAATSVTPTTATLNGSGNPNGDSTEAWFRYATSSPGGCNDTFGTRMPASGGTDLGAGTSSSAFSQPVDDLLPGVTYYFCAIAKNAVGTSFGAVGSFITPAAPTVSTLAATPVTATSATLNGSVDPNGHATTGWFRYGTTSPGTCNTTFGTSTPTSSMGSGSTAIALTQPLSGLAPATTYYFCAIASSSIGTTLGGVLSFTTPAAPPAVTTVAASDLTAETALLNGTASPNGSATTGWFRYHTSHPGSCSDTFGTRAPASGGTSLGSGNSAVAYSTTISGLSAGTTYYFCAIASSAIGTSVGSVLALTTAAAPVVTTAAATAVSSTDATLHGAANPSLAATTAYFRYGTTNPGTCTETFGTRAPASGGTSVGAGASAVPYSQALTGLSPATTYYFCAIASNAGGTGFGAVRSFTTTAAPSVSTAAASGVSSTVATLNAMANPNMTSATGWFRYATTSPGTCTDSFGTRAPSAGGTALGAGSSAVPYSRPLTGLLPGTTYYFCAIASNSVGTAFGSVLSFTTAAAPTVTTEAASSVSSTGATLNGSANPNTATSTGWFRYATTSPGTCNDSFGTRAPASGGTSLGAGSSAVPYSQALSGLASGTTYYFCAIASSSLGTRFGAVLSFTTPAAPSVTTAAASALSSTGATLHGSASPNLLAASGWFRYGATHPGSCDDTFGTRAPASGGVSLGAGASAAAYSQELTGLSPGITYYFCAIASNAAGTGLGAVLSFTTPATPTVTTSAASAVTSTTATLEGSASPNGAATTGWFRYATTSPGTCTDSFGTRAPLSGGTSLGAGTSAAPYSQPLAGLSPSTTYYFCAIASNSVGTRFGAVLSFTTPAAPSVTSEPATAVTSSGATLHGAASPNGTTATGWFRYSTTNPGSCNDTFGLRAPATAGSPLGMGSSAVAFSQSLTGLSPGTPYYYCALASNSVGTSFGSVLSFTTPAAASVTTEAATGITSTGAVLHGSANPRLAAATGWFRYATTSPGSCSDTFGTRAPASGGVALGAGSTAVPYSEALTDLVPGTTYYFCAIASSSAGTGYGAVLSFTTPATPSVTSAAATGMSGTTATLNGSATPNFAAATGWFRFGTTDPGSCSDSFGTRAPASGGTALGAGSVAVPYSQMLTGLSPGTRYWFCAIASSSAGTGLGAVLSFTTAAAPSVTSAAPTGVSSTASTLHGAASPNLSATTGWFRYDTTHPGSCSDTFGTRAPTSGGTSLGAASSPVTYLQPLTALTPGTTYYYCAIASNAVGTSFGEVLSFSTAAAPSVTTEPVAGVTSTTATLHGSANPNLSNATGWFRYDTTDPGTCSDTFGARAPSTGGSPLGAGASHVAYSRSLSGLTPGRTYYYCAIAGNGVGTGFGTVQSFATPGAPIVTSDAASEVTSTGATLNGSANPSLASTTAWFRYDATDPGTCDDTFGTRAPAAGVSLGAGSSAVAYAETLADLVPGTTYYFCAIAENTVGMRFGPVLSFTTSAPPAVTSEAASDITSTSATLNASASPNLADATGWFRYDTSDPGSCNELFGTRAPTSGGFALGAGSAAVSYSAALTDLLPGTTYYYCAIASNSVGVGLGSLLSFTTAGPPSVTTAPVSAVSGTGATLNASASPNLADATGWFRYDTTAPAACDDTFGTRAPASGGASLGAGSSAVPFSEAVTSLSPDTTYYYCAIASNAVGTGFGEVLSFTTPAAPLVITEAATEVTGTAATLNGSASPSMSETTAWFRYDTADPGACDDAFGTRAPSSDGTNVGDGSSAVPYAESIGELAPATTYYYCAIAENAFGASFGEVLSFTTPAAVPSVTTNPPTDVATDSAVLNGSALPNGDAATAWFRYDATDPGACDDSFGVRAPSDDGAALGDGVEPVAFAEMISGLEPGTLYYYCAIASNSLGTSFGEIVTFMPGALAPEVTTESATEIEGTLATLAGTANPNGTEATGWFRYGDAEPEVCDDSFGARAPESGGVALGEGTEAMPFGEPLTGLEPSFTYFYCAAASNLGGATFGEVLSFTTAAVPPVVRTVEPVVDALGAVTLGGAADPSGSEATGWLRYDSVDPGACDDTFGTRVPADGVSLGAGRDEVPFSELVPDLAPGTYYVCALASNEAGVATGELLTFEIPEAPAAGGCGCRTVSARSMPLTGVIPLLGLILLAVRRRRRA